MAIIDEPMTWIMFTILGLVALWQLHLLYGELNKINENLTEDYIKLQRIQDKLSNIDVSVRAATAELQKSINAKANKPKQANAKSRENKRN